jgi:D-alanyl-lipoteichoic acid acyltransferase DltB (MBOAT superfamily)
MLSGHLLPQLQATRVVTPEAIAVAAQLLLIGYLKKVGIADAVAPYVDKAFADPSAQSAPTLLLGLYLFAIQVYCDFSGYTDIARGVSRMFGIELTVNFRQPYLARDIAEFWRCWHISLSTWLRDYLYIPLGGNRLGAWKTYRNLLLTMLLGGLWHGASWTFVVWGGLQGTFLAVHRFLTGNRKSEHRPSPEGHRQWAIAVLQAMATFHLVCFAWTFFRAPDLATAGAYLRGIASGRWAFDLAVRNLAIATGCYSALMLAIDLGSRRLGGDFPLSGRAPTWVRGLAYASAILIISFVGGSRVVPFLYFQF